jgi:SAM-dependent methyltransferase
MARIGGSTDRLAQKYDHPSTSEVAMRELQKKLAMKMQARNIENRSGEVRGTGPELRLPRRRIASVLDLSEDVLRLSGIVRGMRVLHLECGTGDASLRIAKLVGPSGLVIGIDRSTEAVELAQRRATTAGQCYWTRFIAADPEIFTVPGPFDAVVARLAPGAFPLRLAAHVRPGGLVVLVPHLEHPGDSSRRRDLFGRHCAEVAET